MAKPHLPTFNSNSQQIIATHSLEYIPVDANRKRTKFDTILILLPFDKMHDDLLDILRKNHPANVMKSIGKSIILNLRMKGKMKYNRDQLKSNECYDFHLHTLSKITHEV